MIGLVLDYDGDVVFGLIKSVECNQQGRQLIVGVAVGRLGCDGLLEFKHGFVVALLDDVEIGKVESRRDKIRLDQQGLLIVLAGKIEFTGEL